MNRMDFGSATLALLMGFILSAGITGFLVAANGYQFPMPAPVVGTLAGPAVSAVGQELKLAAAPQQAPVEVKVLATDLKFNPGALQAKVGQPVKIVLDNKGMIEHDIAFPTVKADKPAADLKVLAKKGQVGTLEFTPTATGTFEYVCTIPGHKEAGMKGSINVTD